jgi:hypothetical protein
MAARNPQDVAQNWASKLGGATQKIANGVANPKRSPTQSAAAAADKWQARLADPATKAKFISSLGRVSTADWQAAMTSKGIPRIPSGANAAIPKFTTFLSSFLPFQDSVTQSVHALPSNNLEDNINRMVAQVRGTARYRRGQ